MAAVSMWWLIRRRPVDADAFRSTLRLGAVTLLVAGLGTIVTGDIQGKVMTEVQPMKMAAAEALYEDAQPAPFSVLTVGSLSGDEPFYQLEVPHVLSYLATGTWDGEVRGINSLQAEYEETYGPGNYKPYIPVTYWSFRLMITCGGLAMAIGAWMLWSTRRGRVPRGDQRWPIWLAVASTLMCRSFSAASGDQV